MTSGNLSEEPIAYRDEDALGRLEQIADYFLVHDRQIHMRCDDSVARTIDRRELIIRRSRGYAPQPIFVASPSFNRFSHAALISRTPFASVKSAMPS